MAIKVNGTTVINDSRALSNIASVDATTVATLNAGGVGGGGFEPTTVSGTSHALNLGSFNYFESGTLTGATTISFSNVPTEARWQYSYIPGALPTGWDLSVGLKKVVNANVLQSSNAGNDVFFKPDGTRMYVCQTSTMEEYNLSTAWDITTATYSRAKTTTQNGNNSQACFFHPSGTYFWQADPWNGYIGRWTMSTAWNVSTAYMSQADQPQYSFGYGGLFFKPDGTRMYVAGDNGKVDQYNLSTPWDTTWSNGLSTRTDTFQPGGSGTVVGLHFKSDGTRMYVARQIANSVGFVQEYSLSTAWVLSTATAQATYTFTAADNVNENQGLYIREESGNSGINVYFSNVQGTNAGNMNHYNMALANAVTLPSSVDGILPTDNPTTARRTIDFVTLNGGTDVRILGVEDINQ